MQGKRLYLLMAAAAVCLLAVPAGADYWHTPLAVGPDVTGLWHFDEGAGSLAHDSAGSVDNAAFLTGGASFVHVGVTDHGGLHAPADFGYALSLDGSTGYAIVDDDPELEFPGVTLTVEFWLNPGDKNWQRVINKYIGTPNRSWEAMITGDAAMESPFGDGQYHLVFRFSPTGGESGQMFKAAEIPIVPNRWQFVSLRFDATGAPQVLVNGAESALVNIFGSTVDNLTGVKDTDVAMGFGAYDAGGFEGTIPSYLGLIDDIRIARVAVPEPCSLLALGGGIAAFLTRLARRRR